MEIILPWFPRILSPNTRAHWSKIAAAKKEYKKTCWALTFKASGYFLGKAKAKINLHIQFYPPSRRKHDIDNCLASIKSGLDGVAMALGVDDSNFKITMELMQEPSAKIIIIINEADLIDLI